MHHMIQSTFSPFPVTFVFSSLHWHLLYYILCQLLESYPSKSSLILRRILFALFPLVLFVTQVLASVLCAI